MIKLSFIVPVYRVEKYLEKCVNSLLNQNLKKDEYEIILVDDGSDDDCPAMCDSFAAQHSHIRVIHQANGGLSAARNTGIRNSQGTYLCFVDSDDFVENCYNDILHIALQYDLDILKYRYQVIKNNHIIPRGDNHRIDNRIYSGESFLSNKMNEYCFCWLYLVKRSLVIDTNTFFSEHIKYEDIDWTPRILLCAQKVMVCNIIAYNYTIRDGSITHPQTKTDWKKIIDNYFVVLDLTKRNGTKAIDQTWFNSMCSSIVTTILSIAAQHLYEDCHVYIQQAREAYPNPLKCHNTFALKERIKARIVKLSPSLYCLIRHVGL